MHNPGVAWAVSFHADFSSEFDELQERVQDELLARLKLLEQFGPTLGRPHVDTLKGFSPRQHEGAEVRRAIVLVAGDKSGGSERRFYKQLLDKADERLDEHLAELKKEAKK